MHLLLAILLIALSACTETQPVPQPSPTTSKPFVYRWIGDGPQPTSQHFFQDRYACLQQTETTDWRRAPSESHLWRAHLNLCMLTKGWGQKKTID